MSRIDDRCSSIRDAVVNGRKGHRMLDALSLDVKAGEIMGLAGVEGNGQVALANVLSSLVALDEGSVTIDGLEVRTGRAGNLAHVGVSVVPEDRHVAGCFLTMSVAENLVFNDLDSISKRGVLSRAAIRSRHTLGRAYEIKTSSLDAPMSSLSGGNQQRVVLARAWRVRRRSSSRRNRRVVSMSPRSSTCPINSWRLPASVSPCC